MGSLEFDWEEEEISLAGFAEKYGASLPKVVCVRDGFDDEEAKHSYASDEVYFIVAVECQTRVVVRDRARRLLSLPLEYPVYTRLTHKDGKFVTKLERPKLIKQIIRRIHNKVCTENHIVFLDNQPVDIQTGLGGTYQTKFKCDVLEILDLHQQKYLIGHSVINGEIESAVTALPIYVPITVSVATDIDTLGSSSLEDFCHSELQISQKERGFLDMEDYYNNDVMVLDDHSMKDLDNFKTKEEVLLRIILRTKEFRLSLDPNVEENMPGKKDLAKRVTKDRMSLPPPPPPPTNKSVPGIHRSLTTIEQGETPPLSPAHPPPPPPEFADGPREVIPLPTKTPPTKRHHFKLQNLIPSGGFPSLEKIKEKVNKKSGKARRYMFGGEEKKSKISKDMISVDSTDHGRPLSPFSDYDDDLWSDDSFDENFDDDFDLDYEDSENKKNNAGVIQSDTEGSSKEEKVKSPGGFSAELQSKLRLNGGNDAWAEVQQTDKGRTIFSSNRSKSLDNLSDIGTTSVSPPKVSPGIALIPPSKQLRPSLPSKPKGHFKKLSCGVVPPNTTGSESRNGDQSSRKSVFDIVSRMSGEKADQSKLNNKPKLTKKPNIAEKPKDSMAKPTLPPKPKEKEPSNVLTGAAEVTGNKPLPPILPKKPKLTPLSPIPKKPAITGSKPNRNRKRETLRKSALLRSQPADDSKESDKDKQTVPSLRMTHAVKPKIVSPPTRKQEQKSDHHPVRKMHILPKKGFEDAAYADVESSHSNEDLPALIPDDHLYDEVYVATEVQDRSSGDGAENDEIQGHSEGQPKTNVIPLGPSPRAKKALIPPKKIEDMYAKPILLKKKSLSLAEDINDDVNYVEPEVPVKTEKLLEKYSNLSEVPVDLSQLSVLDVVECLSLLKMSKHSDDFKNNEIDGTLLSDLDESVLQTEFSFSPFDAKKLVKFTNGWRPKLK